MITMSGMIIPMSVQQSVQNEVDTYVAQRVSYVFEVVLNKVNLEGAEPILDIDGACKVLKCSEPVLNEYVKNYGLKKHKAKRKVYYLLSECIEFIANLPAE